MTVREVVTEINKAMHELEEVNFETKVKKTITVNQGKIHSAYKTLDELKKKLQGGTKE